MNKFANEIFRFFSVEIDKQTISEHILSTFSIHTNFYIVFIMLNLWSHSRNALTNLPSSFFQGISE